MTLILHGNCEEQFKNIKDETVDAIITDPPYGILFMNNKWDYNVPSIKLWKESLRVLKKGGYLLSFSSPKTYHRLVCNVEDAGFEIRDQILWIYGEGMPKSKSLLKPAHEPIVMAIKPGELHELNIDKSRIGTEKRINRKTSTNKNCFRQIPKNNIDRECIGRYPANLLHDGNTGIEQFNTHPTVKPIKLMEYLIRLVCPVGSLILDPFMGSGSTGKAALQQGMDFIGIEQNAEYIKIAKKRLDKVVYQRGLF